MNIYSKCYQYLSEQSLKPTEIQKWTDFLVCKLGKKKKEALCLMFCTALGHLLGEMNRGYFFFFSDRSKFISSSEHHW